MSKRSRNRSGKGKPAAGEATGGAAVTKSSGASRRRGPAGAAWTIGLVAVLAVVGLLLWRGGGVSEGLPAALKPGAAAGYNVLLITLDTTRADHIGCYGYAAGQTPSLDRLAAEGLRFEKAIAPVPLTLPSHASILTGLEPPSHGVRNNGEFRLDEEFTSLAEVLQQSAYDTAGFVSSFVLDRRFGLAQGMATYDDTVVPKAGKSFGGHDSERNAEAVTTAALGWLNSRKGDRPYFLWVHYYDPHADYEPPPMYLARFPTRPYDGEIAYMDAQIGRLMAAVERDGGRSRTLAVVVADHGESLDEHNEQTHGKTIYDATQRVPLIVWAPGLFSRGHVVSGPVVGVIDVYPTVLELLGLESPSKVDGVSLLQPEPLPGRTIYMETVATYLDNGWAPLYGLRGPGDKYIHAPKPEYYDLVADPHELNNLYAQLTPAQQDRVAELAGELVERVKDSPSAAEIAASALALDPDSLDRLRSLGYFAGGDDPAPADESNLADPKDMLPAWRMLQEATRLTDRGQYDLALAKARRAYESSPNDRMVLLQLGTIQLFRGELEEGRKYLEAYTEIGPTSNVYVLLAQIAVQQRRFADAEGLVQQALALEPEHGGAFLVKAELLTVAGRLQEALAMIDYAEQVDPHRTAKAAAQRRTAIRQLMGGG